MTGEGPSGWRRSLGLLFAAASPIVGLVLLLPLIAGWGPVVSPPLVPAAPDGAVPEILADLSSDLNAIGVGVLVGVAALLRVGAGRALLRRTGAAVLVTTTTAVGSCYAGFRFRFQLAEQLLLVKLDLGAVGDRLATQGALLLIAVVGLVYLGLMTLLEEPSGS